MKTSFAVVGCAALLFSPLAIHAQQPAVAPAAPVEFPVKSEPVIRQGDNMTKTYTLLSTEPPSSKLPGQKIQLRIDGVRPGGTSMHTLVINTGKFHTVGATEKMVADIFVDSSRGPVAAGQDFGQIGNINLGGELHFIAVSNDQLDYKFVARDKPDNVGHLSREDVQTFLPILTGAGG